MKWLRWWICGFALVECMSCNGIFSGIYDEPVTGDVTDYGFSVDASHPQKMTLIIDASDYEAWTYVSLKNMTIEKYPVPLACEGVWDGQSGITYNQVCGAQFSPISLTKTDAQPEPAEWDFAIHRFDVRTHYGSAACTSLTDIDQARHLDVSLCSFSSDVWSTTQAMVDLSGMMAYRIGYQNISLNPVLSEWVKMDISTPPPTFTATGCVYILKLSDGSMAAMRMRSYMDYLGRKGHLTIDMYYPL